MEGFIGFSSQYSLPSDQNRGIALLGECVSCIAYAIVGVTRRSEYWHQLSHCVAMHDKVEQTQ